MRTRRRRRREEEEVNRRRMNTRRRRRGKRIRYFIYILKGTGNPVGEQHSTESKQT